MKTNNSLKPVRKSTYAMLVQSEEKERGLFETIVYGLLVLMAAVGLVASSRRQQFGRLGDR